MEKDLKAIGAKRIPAALGSKQRPIGAPGSIRTPPPKAVPACPSSPDKETRKRPLVNNMQQVTKASAALGAKPKVQARPTKPLLQQPIRSSALIKDAKRKHSKWQVGSGQEKQQPKPCAIVRDAPPPAVAVDYNKPYIIVKDGGHFCTVCNIYATEAHLMSARHLKYVALREGSGDDEEQYDKPYIDWLTTKINEGYYCRLCKKWADHSHLQGREHLKQVEYYEKEPARKAAASEGKTKPSTKPSKEEWDTIWSASDKRPYFHHKPSGMVQWEDPFAAPPPPPWVMVWSAEHRTNYYFNADTHATSMELPPGCDEGGGGVAAKSSDAGLPMSQEHPCEELKKVEHQPEEPLAEEPSKEDQQALQQKLSQLEKQLEEERLSKDKLKDEVTRLAAEREKEREDKELDLEIAIQLRREEEEEERRAKKSKRPQVDTVDVAATSCGDQAPSSQQSQGGAALPRPRAVLQAMPGPGPSAGSDEYGSYGLNQVEPPSRPSVIPSHAAPAYVDIAAGCNEPQHAKVEAPPRPSVISSNAAPVEPRPRPSAIPSSAAPAYVDIAAGCNEPQHPKDLDRRELELTRDLAGVKKQKAANIEEECAKALKVLTDSGSTKRPAPPTWTL